MMKTTISMFLVGEERMAPAERNPGKDKILKRVISVFKIENTNTNEGELIFFNQNPL